MKLLICNGTLIPVNAVKPLYSEMDIAIDGGKIVHIGNIPDTFIPDRVIDAAGKIILPGFVNAHTHLSMGLFRNYANDMDLFSWLTEKIWPIEAKLTEQDVHSGSLLGAVEMIRSGTTAFADMYFFQEATCEAVKQAGIRANIGVTFFGNIEETEKRLPEYYTLVKNWNNACNGRIKIDTAPHAVYTCSLETLKAAREFSLEMNNRIHIHLSETEKENTDTYALHNMTPAAYLESIGMLDRPVYAAHCVHIDQNDMEILKNHAVFPVHNPSSNLKLGSGFAPIPQFSSLGLHTAMGTDGASSNNNLNMLEEMHLTSLIHKGISGDPKVISAYETIRMATIYGAEALGIDTQCGTLEIGKDADMIFIDTRAAHLQPLHDPISAVVYSAQSADIDTVICQGEILMENHIITTLDEEKVIREASETAKDLVSRL